MSRSSRVWKKLHPVSAAACALGCLLAAVLLMATTPVSAEVAVLTDGQGRYVRTIVLGGKGHGVWSPVRDGIDPSTVLNPQGDRFGDSRPIIVERPGTRQPWLVWSAGDGNDLEIAYATWAQGRWHGPFRLEPVDNSHDDLNPSLSFDDYGRPVAVWWRNEPVPRVYLSVHGAGGWSTPLAVSDANTPSVLPLVRVEAQRAVVSYYTPQGQTVLFIPLADPTAGIDSTGPLDGPVPPPDSGWEPSVLRNDEGSQSPGTPDTDVSKRVYND